MLANTVVSDTTLLSNFAHAERPELLRVAFDKVVISPTVGREWKQGRYLGLVPDVGWVFEVITLTADEAQFATRLRTVIDAGESECVALAAMRGWLFLSDDRLARKVAKEHDVLVSGTLGVLIRLIDQDAVTLKEGNMLLSRMIQHGYRSPFQKLDSLI